MSDYSVSSNTMKWMLLAMLICFAGVTAWSQEQSNLRKAVTIQTLYTSAGTKSISEQQMALNKSESADAYQFMSLRKTISAINVMIKSSGEEYWIVQQKRIIDNLVGSSRISSTIPGNQTFKDQFQGWISLFDNKSRQNEVPLYESYSFFYITQFLYFIRNSTWISQSDSNRLWWNHTLSFVEKNIWTKWYERSMASFHNHYRYFLRSRTHMGSHWAGIAMYLTALSSNAQIKSQAAELIQQYDTLLKRNLRTFQGGYVWNSTYDNVKGTYAAKSSASTIQDVSHGNHVVSYIIAAYRFGNKDWTIEDIRRLAVTLKTVIYDNQNNRFRDNVDGSASSERPGWGNFVSDGWLKLAAYDDEVKTIFQQFEKSGMLKKYNQDFLFRATLSEIQSQNLR